MNLPIDISVSKMIDWIIDRRHCQITWQKKAATAHAALKKALVQSEGDEQLDAMREEYGLTREDGFLLVHLVNRFLLETDGGTGWTGIGATERSKIWGQVGAIYKHENVHLAECAVHLTRLVQKVYPALDRGMQKARQKQDECVERSLAMGKAAKSAEKRYSTECARLAIDETLPPRVQLIDSLVKLPAIVNSISASVSQLKPMIEYYNEFMAHSCGEGVEMGLINLTLLCDHPQCTAYEVLHGKRPTTVLRDAISTNVVDFDIELDDEADEDYAIDMVEEFEIEEDVDIEVEEENVLITQSIVAKGNEAKFVLENSETRDLVMDDLAELEFFVLGLNSMTTSNLPKKLKTAELSSWSGLISEVYAKLNNEQTSKLLQLSDDPSEADRVVDKLNKHKMMASRRQRESEQALVDKEAFVKEETELTEQKRLTGKQIVILKGFLEETISTKYQKRPVNIQGCRL